MQYPKSILQELLFQTWRNVGETNQDKNKNDCKETSKLRKTKIERRINWENFSLIVLNFRKKTRFFFIVLIFARGKPVLSKLIPRSSYFDIISVATVWCFIVSYDPFLSPCSYTIAVCSVFKITLQILSLCQKQNAVSIYYSIRRDHDSSSFWKLLLLLQN